MLYFLNRGFAKAAILCVFASSMLQAGKWTSMSVLSTGGDGWESTSAIDAAGNSLAFWDERTFNPTISDYLWSRVRPAGGTWTPRVYVTNQELGITGPAPTIRITAAGLVTAVWSDSAGAYTSDLPVGGSWSAPQLLVAGVSSPLFAENRFGDAAVIWVSGAGLRSGPNYVMASRRTAGGPWGAPQTLATADHVSANSAAISDNGDLIVAWESFDTHCTGYKCTSSNFILHGLRQPFSGTISDSGALTSADAKSHQAHATIDAQGNAGVTFSSATRAIEAITQPAAGGSWTPPVIIYSNSSFSAGMSTDLAGNVIVPLQDLISFKVVVVSGNLATNTWSPGVIVSGVDASPNQVVFAEGTNGAAVVAWASNSGTTITPIRVVTRSLASSAWTAAKTISPANLNLGGPESAAINDFGDAIVTFAGYASNFQNHIEYAATYQH